MIRTAVSAVWHPFTQMATCLDVPEVVRGEGAMLYLKDGRSVIDCISSWWVNLHGHGHPAIAGAIAAQASTLEHVIFAGFTHEPAERLAHELVSILPSKLKRVFFSDNGSTSVEVAIKMAYQYWQQVGQPERQIIIGFDGGYHGDTLGAMSAGGSSTFWDPFRDLMFPIEVLPFPETWQGDETVEQKEKACLEKLGLILEKNCGRVAAIIIEPLVQGAAGMRMCRPQFLKSLSQICDQANILLIFDEVMTGFGRTGDLFACLKAGIEPDLVCLSKGLTGGFVPMSVTVAAEKIFAAFLGDTTSSAFLHGHSYTANPIGCAAALSSLQLLQEKSSYLAAMEALHKEKFEMYLGDIADINKVRFCGTIMAFEIATTENTGYFNNIGPILKKEFLAQGLLLRPLGNVVYLMLPYCVDNGLLDKVYADMAAVVRKVTNKTDWV